MPSEPNHSALESGTAGSFTGIPNVGIILLCLEHVAAICQHWPSVRMVCHSDKPKRIVAAVMCDRTQKILERLSACSEAKLLSCPENLRCARPAVCLERAEVRPAAACKRRGRPAGLASRAIVLLTDLTNPVSGRCVYPFLLRYVPTRGTNAVVVMHTILWKLLHFVDRVKGRTWRHCISPARSLTPTRCPCSKTGHFAVNHIAPCGCWIGVCNGQADLEMPVSSLRRSKTTRWMPTAQVGLIHFQEGRHLRVDFLGVVPGFHF
jgi:hypothetical protein